MNSLQETPDWAALVARVLSGDKKAAEDLADKLGVLAYNYYRRVGLSREDAEDLAQEFTIRLITRLNQFDGRNFIGWAFTALRNLLIEHYRKRNRQVPALPLLDTDCEIATAGPAHNGLLTEAEHAALEEVLAQLQPDERTLIESQTGFQKVPFEQMARELGISKGHARVRYHRAKEKIETILRKDGRMKTWLARHQSQQLLNP